MHRSDKAGGEDRAAQVLLVGPLVDVARIPARDAREVLAGKELLHVAGDEAEAILPARLDRHGEVAFLAGVIHQQLGILDGGEGIARFAEHDVEIGALFLDLVQREDIAGGNLESVAQFGGVVGRTDIAEIDRAEAVARARHDIEARSGRIEVRLFGQIGRSLALHDGAGDLRIEIAVDPQQFVQQRLVVARLHGEASEVLIVVELFDRGKRFEPFEEFLAHGEQVAIAREDEDELVRKPLFAAHRDLRHFVFESDEFDRIVIQRLQRRDLRQLDIGRPRYVDQRHFGERRRRIERRRRVGIALGLVRHAFARPLFRIFDGGIGDQVLERGRILHVLRECGLRAEEQRGGKRRQADGPARNRFRRAYTRGQARACHLSIRHRENAARRNGARQRVR